MHPLVSIIIINYNTFDLTCKCIKSIIQYANLNKTEIIVVDNGSTETATFKIKEIFPEIIFVQSNTNLGFAAGNNLGISRSHGEYILLLNSDTELTNDCISPAIEYLREHNKIGAITTRIIYPDGKPQPVIQRFPTICKEVKNIFRWHKIRRIKNNMLGEFFTYDREQTGDWIWGTFFMIQRDTIIRLPEQKLPETFFMYCEDIEWGYAIQKLQLKVAFVPVGDVIHYIGASSANNKNNERENMIKKNEYLLLKKNHGSIHVRLIYLLRSIFMTSIRNIPAAKVYFQMVFAKM